MRGTAGGSPVLSPSLGAPVPHAALPHPSSPLPAPLLPLAQCTVPSGLQPCLTSRNPALSAQSSHRWPQRDRERPPTHTHAHVGTHIHTHGGHDTSTQGCGSRTPEGSVLSLAFRAQPAPETALARPGPSTSASPLLGLSPLQAPPQRKRGTVPTWRASGGICLSACLALMTSPTSFVSASHEGKGAKQSWPGGGGGWFFLET